MRAVFRKQNMKILLSGFCSKFEKFFNVMIARFIIILKSPFNFLFLGVAVPIVAKVRRIRSKYNINSRGIAVLEASLTLPIILMIIFFIIEMMNVNNTRTAMDSIALEATLEFIASKSTDKFPDIIKKYKPFHVNTKNIKYYFAVYENLEKMCSVTPFGNEETYWPGDAPNYNSGTSAFVDNDKNGNFLGRNTSTTSGYISLSNQSKPETDFYSGHSDVKKETLTGKAFVLTVVCDYQFSSAFVAKLFAGGSNTKDGQHFLIWGRGVGICN